MATGAPLQMHPGWGEQLMTGPPRGFPPEDIAIGPPMQLQGMIHQSTSMDLSLPHQDSALHASTPLPHVPPLAKLTPDTSPQTNPRGAFSHTQPVGSRPFTVDFLLGERPATIEGVELAQTYPQRPATIEGVELAQTYSQQETSYRDDSMVGFAASSAASYIQPPFPQSEETLSPYPTESGSQSLPPFQLHTDSYSQPLDSLNGDKMNITLPPEKPFSPPELIPEPAQQQLDTVSCDQPYVQSDTNVQSESHMTTGSSPKEREQQLPEAMEGLPDLMEEVPMALPEAIDSPKVPTFEIDSPPGLQIDDESESSHPQQQSLQTQTATKKPPDLQTQAAAKKTPDLQTQTAAKKTPHLPLPLVRRQFEYTSEDDDVFLPNPPPRPEATVAKQPEEETSTQQPSLAGNLAIHKETVLSLCSGDVTYFYSLPLGTSLPV